MVIYFYIPLDRQRMVYVERGLYDSCGYGYDFYIPLSEANELVVLNAGLSDTDYIILEQLFLP